jgi:sugar phosphate permease
MFASGFAKAIYGSLALVIVLQIANGWVQGMGWPPCGKTMVHWFSTRERGLVVSVWNVSHNVGGGLVATFALFGRQAVLAASRDNRRGLKRPYQTRPRVPSPDTDTGSSQLAGTML